MILKSKSIATKLLLSSTLSAAVIIVGIVTFVKLSMIPQLTTQALKEQTQALALSLKGVRSEAAQWREDALAKDNILDSFSNNDKGVATFFLQKNDQYIRVATTLKKDDGSRAIGTALDPNTEAFKALAQGQPYTGSIMLFDRPHMATYLPVSFNNGTRGAVFIGIDYQSADPILERARQMDYVVIGVGVLSIALLTIGFVFSIRVEQAHRETEDIFRTTQEGLFLLDHDLLLGTQTSRKLSQILGFDAKPGNNFLELLKPLVTPKTYDTAKEYLELLLRHDIKEKLVTSLNPLECIEIAAMRANGRVESRFLQIHFNRVLQGRDVTHLLVTANDITKQVKLERELKESERRVQDQMGMMVHILQADPQMLQDFLKSATDGLDQINEILRTSDSKNGISNEQVDAILRNAHKLKGDASSLQLEAITQSLHAFETLLHDLRTQNHIKGEELLPVTVRVKELYSEIGAVKEVIARISQVRGVVSVEPSRPAREFAHEAEKAFVRQWNNFAQQLASKQEKQVELSYQGLDLETLPSKLRETMNSMVNQFIRNALIHGVETPQERKQHGKRELGHLSVYISDQGDGMVELSFRDDGRGINPESIREALIRSGRLSADEAKALSTRQLTLQIFEPGLSTQKEINEDAGRGVGLDSVKDMIAKMGGRIRIGTTRGEYCHFRVQLPFKTELEESIIKPKQSEEVA